MSGLKRFKLLFINNDKGYLVLFEIYNRRNIIKRCFSDFLMSREYYFFLKRFLYWTIFTKNCRKIPINIPQKRYKVL